ncbi:hypothetical protein [Endozoicomonas atrinae]
MALAGRQNKDYIDIGHMAAWLLTYVYRQKIYRLEGPDYFQNTDFYGRR